MTRATVGQLRAALETAAKALDFYANPDTYFAVGFFPDPPCGDFMTDFSPASDYPSKPGKRARAALGKMNRQLARRPTGQAEKGGRR